MFGGAYIGQGLGGGGAMFVSEQWGFDASFLYISLLLTTIFAFVLVFVKDPSLAGRVAERTASVWAALAGSVRMFVRELGAGFFRSGAGPMVGVAFALLPVGAMALSTSVSSALQVDLGMSDGQIAELNIYSTVLSGLGCVIGGWAADRLGQRKILAAWYLVTTLPTLYLATALSSGGGLEGVSVSQYFVASLVFSFSMGMHYGTGAAVFMGLTNPLVAATQFTGYMALKNLTISYTNMWQGALVDTNGYATVLYLDAALVLIPVLLIPFLAPAAKKTQVPPSKGAPLPEAG
jgi:PAT family beta-lactamase induction signal transducer AmpG